MSIGMVAAEPCHVIEWIKRLERARRFVRPDHRKVGKSKKIFEKPGPKRTG